MGIASRNGHLTVFAKSHVARSAPSSLVTLSLPLGQVIQRANAGAEKGKFHYLGQKPSHANALLKGKMVDYSDAI